MRRVLISLSASDPPNAALVSAAQAGINQAETSVAHILEAVVAGQNASATDRGGVETGLNAVLSALSNITTYVLPRPATYKE